MSGNATLSILLLKPRRFSSALIGCLQGQCDRTFWRLCHDRVSERKSTITVKLNRCRVYHSCNSGDSTLSFENIVVLSARRFLLSLSLHVRLKQLHPVRDQKMGMKLTAPFSSYNINNDFASLKQFLGEKAKKRNPPQIGRFPDRRRTGRSIAALLVPRHFSNSTPSKHDSRKCTVI